MKQSILNVELNNKRIFLRVDYNVPIQNGKILDSFRIKSSFKTLDYILSQKIKCLYIASHLGRPNGWDLDYSLKPVLSFLKENYFDRKGLKITFRNFLTSYKEVENVIVLFENLRFYEEEDADSDVFKSYLRGICDIAVNDAFGVVHRNVSSICRTGLPCYAGLLLHDELKMIETFEKEDFDLIILGGKKISTKVEILIKCIQRSKCIAIVGAMCFPFLKHKNYDIGTSFCEYCFDIINKIYNSAEKFDCDIMLPVDILVYNSDRDSYETKSVGESFENGTGQDIGRNSIKILQEKIMKSKRIFWNGPIGLYENEKFANGTREIVYTLLKFEKNGGYLIIGGGDTACAIGKFEDRSKFERVSTGGGSLLALLQGEKLPGIEILQEEK